MTNTKCVFAIDRGTTSPRAIIFDRVGRVTAVGQEEREQIFPRTSWVEHSVVEIWDSVYEVVAQTPVRA